MGLKKTFIISTIALLLSVPVYGQTYTVKSGDSLWVIASITKPDTVSIHQMISAIHEENSALLGADISNIQPGMELVIPDGNKVAGASIQSAEQLLSNGQYNHQQTTRTERIQSIEKQIQRIEADIEDTIGAMKASRENFSTQFNQ